MAYDILEGRKFEGHTMLPMINAFKKEYNLIPLVVFADTGLLSKENIKTGTGKLPIYPPGPHFGFLKPT